MEFNPIGSFLCLFIERMTFGLEWQIVFGIARSKFRHSRRSWRRNGRTGSHWSKKNDKQHLENVWRKQAKFMDNPAKSYGGFQKNDRRQTMIFYSDLYFKTILGYTIPSAQAN